MSRQEDRGSDSRRHRSRFDQEPSPKRSRRDGKPATERPPSDSNLDSGGHLDQEQRRHRRLQDALPLETPRVQDSKVETGAGGEESEKKSDRRQEGAKRSSDPTEIPRSQSYFQHDDRGNAGKVGRSFSRRPATEHGLWKDSREEHRERPNRTTANDTRQNHENAKAHGKDNHSWRHDRYFEMEADPKPPARKRPAFREQKILEDSVKAAAEPQKPNHSDHPARETAKKDEKEGHISHQLDKPERPPATERDGNREEARRGRFSSTDRYGGGNYRRRDRFPARQGHQSGRGRVEKWKHDLYDEANRSPTPKNEEDQIAKVEALLAS